MFVLVNQNLNVHCMLAVTVVVRGAAIIKENRKCRNCFPNLKQGLYKQRKHDPFWGGGGWVSVPLCTILLCSGFKPLQNWKTFPAKPLCGLSRCCHDSTCSKRTLLLPRGWGSGEDVPISRKKVRIFQLCILINFHGVFF